MDHLIGKHCQAVCRVIAQRRLTWRADAFENSASQGFMRAFCSPRMMTSGDKLAMSLMFTELLIASLRLWKGAGKVTNVKFPLLLLLVLGWCRAADRSMYDTSESAVVTYK